jgi:ribosomal protein S27AE
MNFSDNDNDSPVAMIERDVFCGACHAKIDREVRNAKYRDDGLAAAIVCGDALRHHRRESGCSGLNGWTTGPWTDEAKKVTVHVDGDGSYSPWTWIEKYHCVLCGKKTVWAEHSDGDYYLGALFYCSSCGEAFYSTEATCGAEEIEGKRRAALSAALAPVVVPAAAEPAKVGLVLETLGELRAYLSECDDKEWSEERRLLVDRIDAAIAATEQP